MSKTDFVALSAGVALIIAVLGISTASILIVYAQQELGSNAIIFNRLGLAALVFGFCQGRELLQGNSPYLRNRYFSTGKVTVIDATDVSLLFVSGITFASSLLVWAWSMTETSIANATLLENVLPLFTTLGGWLFLGQRFSRQFVIGMIIAVCGAIAIGLGDMQIPENHVIGDFAAIASAIFAAAALLSMEKLSSKFETIWIMFWTCLIGAIFVFLIMIFTETEWFPHSWGGRIAVIALALISQCLGQGLLTFCLTRFTSAFVAVTLLSIPAIAATFAWILFAQTLSLINIFWFIVVLVGIYVAIAAPSPSKIVLSTVQD